MDADERLLNTWSQQRHHRGKAFARDGIIDLHRWRLAKPKVLFLLKEAYHDSSQEWDYREYLNEWSAKDKPTLRNAAYWCYAIYHVAHGNLPALPSDQGEYSKAIECLRSGAIVNVKKSAGQRNSSDKNIAWYAARDKRIILKQIDQINPDIVVCGNTWQFIEKWWPRNVKVSAGVYRVARRIFVDFCHPSDRGSDELKYYALAGQLITFLLHESVWRVSVRGRGWNCQGRH